MPKLILALFLLVIVFGGMIMASPKLADSLPIDLPDLSLQPPQFSGNWKDLVQTIDEQGANFIRQVSSGQMPWKNLKVSEKIQEAAQATVSANLTTTPGQLLETWKNEGSQAVLGTMASQAEVSLNGVSTTAINEARYQYCKGVVEAYEKQ